MVVALIFGRDWVLDETWAALDVGDPVLLTGPAGIGKSAIWRALLDTAGAAGWLVLSCAPAESESSLALAALGDLLAPLASGVARLPAPQRTAAESALLTGVGAAVDDRALGAATRSLLLDAVAAGRRVLVAVDDAAWLDPPSERALRFALRRTAGVGVLVTLRADAPGPAPLDLDRGDGRLRRVDVGPLGAGALHHLLRDRLGARLSRPLLSRIARDSGGNPLLAIELTRAVLRLPRLPSPGEELPFPTTMPQVMAEAVRVLPQRSREAVRLAALLSVPTLAGLRAAGVDPADLDAAEEARLLTVSERAVQFSHPLYAAAVRQDLPAGLRRRLHRQLADAVSDPDERARQLAQCVTGPDAAVAAELTAAADRQRRRGAPQLAAGLYERAALLSPAGDEQGRRLVAAARCRYEIGDYRAAAAEAEQVAADYAGELRAQALLLRSEVAWSADEPPSVSLDAALRALDAAGPGSVLAGRVHAHLGMVNDAPGAAREHSLAACELLGASAEDAVLLSASLQHLFFSEVRGGLGVRVQLLDRALALEAGRPAPGATIPAIWWRSIDEHDRARDRLGRMLELAADAGDEPGQHEALCHLAETELLAGRFDAAAGHVHAVRELGEQLGTGLMAETWLAGLLDAYRGDLERARQTAEAGLRHARTADDVWSRRIFQLLAAFTALSQSRMDDAAAGYAALAATVDAMGLVEPLALRFEADWVEASVAVGDLDTAHLAQRRLTARHERLARPWTALGLARGEALLAAAAGDDPAPALQALAAARAAVPADVVPVERARCLLTAGVVQRRAKRRRDARTALAQAADEFARLGAGGFAARAHAELARIGARTGGGRELTATERRVAELAARGGTNRAIADALFISPKTVEANLARVYRKLGVSSRAELGVAMAAELTA
ncbi:LuxR C-terminal-related transcriptional regulator [Catellatospora citrea]|uniref:Transcriptional regulator n=1 Tax=Catellatospora citrea TaxID=53366 RepID=A0A8J3NYN0_9ACTN|nr:LuxR family transcriptional regulator [Catellatospora citrea]RKE05546.1 AAA ATPase-like protein [Catellatospora citrea]GIF96896.1 transcriptional regulator [Catellatospora citrea]